MTGDTWTDAIRWAVANRQWGRALNLAHAKWRAAQSRSEREREMWLNVQELFNTES